MTSFKNGEHEATYTYNPGNLRHTKTVDGKTTQYVWDGSEIAAEIDKDYDVIRNKYIYGLDRVLCEGPYSVDTYYQQNSHGDTIATSNYSGATIVTYEYDAFGNQLDADPNDTNPFRYCGQYLDNETGSYYLRARYYQPTYGRFFTADTHWNTGNMIYGDTGNSVNIYSILQSNNLYVYGINNPIMFRDINGNNFLDMIKGFLAGIAKYISKGLVSVKQDYDDELDYHAGAWMGEKYADFMSNHDIVFDVSLSAGFVTVGYSYVDANASGYTAGYVHVGAGLSVGLMPAGASVSIGIVSNAPTPEDYSEGFFDISAALGIGADYCMWPGGSSAISITLTTNASVGVRGDYYILVHSEKDGEDYYDLYKKG